MFRKVVGVGDSIPPGGIVYGSSWQLPPIDMVVEASVDESVGGKLLPPTEWKYFVTSRRI